jgi:hypothetical protein
VIIALLALGALAPLSLVASSSIEIQSEGLPRAILDVDYSAAIQTSADGSCPTGNVGMALENGSLPRGLRITSVGIEGIPKELGAFRFRIRAGNTCASVVRNFELQVVARPVLRAVPEKVEFSVLADDLPQSSTSLVSSTWTGLPYTLSTPDSPWLKVRQAVGSTPESGSALNGDGVIVSVVPRLLPPGIYRRTITVSAWQADAIAIEVVVTVREPERPPVTFLKYEFSQ